MNTDNFTYSSFTGIPIRSDFLTYDGTQASTFQMETSYLSVHCYDNIAIFNEVSNDTEASNSDLTNGTFSGTNDYSTEGPSLSDRWEMYLYSFVAEVPASLDNATRSYEQQTLIFRSRYLNVTAWCPITTKYVESVVIAITITMSLHIELRRNKIPAPT